MLYCQFSLVDESPVFCLPTGFLGLCRNCLHQRYRKDKASIAKESPARFSLPDFRRIKKTKICRYKNAFQ